MRIYSERMNTMIALVGTGFTWLFGAWDLALAVLITAMILDYLTGVTRSVINGDGVNSEKGFKGWNRRDWREIPESNRGMRYGIYRKDHAEIA